MTDHPRLKNDSLENDSEERAINHGLGPVATLEQLGWTPFFAEQFHARCSDLTQTDLRDAASPTIGRVCLARREFYRVLTADGAVDARLGGRLRHQASSPLDLPAVGDWVALRDMRSEAGTVVVQMFSRRTQLLRKAAGKRTQVQVLGANIDVVAVVTSPNHDFNPGRLQRYLCAIAASGARPLLVLNKTDLCPDPAPFVAQMQALSDDTPCVTTCATVGDGVENLRNFIKLGQTLIVVGSSGVGKSTIVNRLLQRQAQRVESTSARHGKGRHVTTHRELFLMPGSGVLIDTPGLRELRVWQSSDIAEDFSDIDALAQHCRFRNCSHQAEPDCAVRQSVEQGSLLQSRLDSFHKLQQEAREQEIKRQRQPT